MKAALRRLIKFILISAWLLSVAGSAAIVRAEPPPPVEPQRVDQAVLQALQEGSTADYVLVFAEKADLSGAYQISDWVERGQYVLDALKAAAARSQNRAQAELQRRGLRYRSFFAGNEIYVYAGNGPALQALVNLPEVARVRAPVTVQLEPAGFPLPMVGPAAPQAEVEGALAWGIADTRADQFWLTYQHEGEGIIVANIDTGVDVSHPALAGAYRCGSDLTNPACWHDPANVCSGTVCDNHGHGTHTMGSMVASNDPAFLYTVGMAPGAKWIACKGCESSDCSDASLNACADWILAPGGDPANRPHVVNNSWGDAGGNDWYAAKVEAWRAAGIFPAFSAGNYGACEAVGSPSDYQSAFASAAHSSSRVIASFSSKGPGGFGDDPYTKPNISAPGASILSTWPADVYPYGDWVYSSGTSMASPHSAGAVALLWSCNSGLVGMVDETFQLLQSSADAAPPGACGAPASGEGNYTYGYGYLNVLAAAMAVCGHGDIHGVITNQADHPLAGASIRATDQYQTVFSDVSGADGSYELFLPEGSFTLVAWLNGYAPVMKNLVLTDGQSLTQDFKLLPGKTVMLPLVAK